MVFAKSVNRQRRAHKLGQTKDQKFKITEVLDTLQSGHLLPHEPVSVLSRPPSRLDLRAAKERFGKSSQFEQVAKPGGRTNGEFLCRERVQPQHVIAPLKGIAAETIEIETSASRDQDFLPGPTSVVQPFEQVAPGSVLMDLVGDP